MELIQRICWNPETTTEEVDLFLELLEKYPDACDDVWMCTHYGYPPMEAHREYAARLAIEAERIRKTHVTVSMQLSNSIGHGDKTGEGKDCSGLVYEGSRAERLVGYDGVEARFSFCWRGRHYKDYMMEQLRAYMIVRPDHLWIDDDLRPDNHAPVEYGCFCDQCIATFNKQHGSDFDREALVREFLHGDKVWRKRYIDFIREGLYEFTYEMAKVVQETSPNTLVCIQNGPRRAYSGFDHRHLLDAIKDATGKEPGFRPGAGAYDDHNPNVILEKMVDLNYQKALLPEYVTSVMPEIENIPCIVFGKSPAGTAFETSCYFAAGYTDMSYSMIRYYIEDAKWHMREFKLFSEQRAYWEELTKRAEQSRQSGLRYFLSMDSWAREVSEEGGMEELNELHYNRANLLLRDAIPMTFEKTEEKLFLLHPEMARILSEEEINYLLTKNVITDGETIAVLTERGYDLGMKAERLEDNKALKVREAMLPHPVNPQGFKNWKTTFYTEGKSDVYYMYSSCEQAEVVSVYEATCPLEAYGEQYPYGIAAAVVPTSKGAKWGVLGYAPWKGIISLHKRNQLLNLADYISGNQLAAKVLTPIQAVLLPRVNEERQTVMVSLINCTIGAAGEVELLIRRPASEVFYYMSQTQEKILLSSRRDGEDYVVTIPDIPAWTVGTVFCDVDYFSQTAI